MRIVITGAAGFIGSVLTARASELGHSVLALDDLSRGLNKLDSTEATFVKHDCQGGFGEVMRDVADAAAFEAGEPPNYHVDAVVHLAAGTGSLDRPYEELVALNVEMTKRVYLDALDFGAEVFVFPTTSLGTVPELRQSPYVRSKDDAMRWLLAQPYGGNRYTTRTQLLPLRFFNVAGAYKSFTEKRQREVHLIPRLAECYRTGQPLVVNGRLYATADGTPSREFVNVLDVADYVLTQIDRAVAGTRLFGSPQHDGTYWIGTGDALTVLDVLAVFRQWFGPLTHTFGPRREYDVGALHCVDNAVDQVQRLLRRNLAPAWVSIRDECAELLSFYGEDR